MLKKFPRKEDNIIRQILIVSCSSDFYTDQVKYHLCVDLFMFCPYRSFIKPLVVVSVYFLRYRLNVFLHPLPEVQSANFLEIQNHWGKVMLRSGLRF